MPNTTVLLGFDFGMRRIGVAVGQTLLKRATPLTTLMAKAGEPDWQLIAKLIKEWGATALVVGIPIDIDGSTQNITNEAKKFARCLQDYFHLPVFEVDERLTTVEARQRVFDKGGFRRLQKEQIDSIAAKLILEQWFQTQKI